MVTKLSSKTRTRERIMTLLLERGALSLQTMYNHLERDGHGKHGSLRMIQDLVYDMAREGDLETVGNRQQRRYKLPADTATAMLPSETPSDADERAIETPSAPAVVVPELVGPDDLQQLLAQQGWSHLLDQLDSDSDDAGDELAIETPSAPAVDASAAIVIGPIAQQIARAVAVTAEHYLQTQYDEHARVLKRNYELVQGLKRKDAEIAQLRAELQLRPYTRDELDAIENQSREKDHQIAELLRKCDQLQRDVDTALATAQEAEQKINALRAIFK